MPVCLPADAETVMCACGSARTVHRGELATDDGRRISGRYLAVHTEHLQAGECEQPSDMITVTLTNPACSAHILVRADAAGTPPTVELSAGAAPDGRVSVVTDPADPRAARLLACALAVIDADDGVRETLGLARRQSKLTLDLDAGEIETWTCRHCDGVHNRAAGFVHEDEHPVPRAAYAFSWVEHPSAGRERFACVEVGLGDFARASAGARVAFSARVLHTEGGIAYALTDSSPGALPALGRALSAVQAREHPELTFVWRVVDLAEALDPRAAACRDWVLTGPRV